MTVAGPTQLAPGEPGTYTATVSAGVAPLDHVVWYVDGQPHATIGVNGSAASVDQPLEFPETGTHPVRVVAVDEDDQRDTATRTVDVIYTTEEFVPIEESKIPFGRGRMKPMRAIISVALSVLLWTSLLVAAPVIAGVEPDEPPEVQCDGDTRTGIIDFPGRIEYTITYNKSAQRVCAIAESTGERNGDFGYSVWIDDSRVSPRDTVELAPGETFTGNQTIIEGIDATRDNHTVEVHPYNGTFYFNFTQEIDPMNEDGVPTPHIENITIKRNGTKCRQPNIVVDVENEGIRNYSPEAVVKTAESDLRWMLPRGSSYSNRLSEANEDVVVGTVKLYGHTYYTGMKYDRVSFVSYPNGTYDTWEPAFEEIPTKREIEEREIYYENESAQDLRGPDVDRISDTASKAGAVLVVLAVVGGLWYRRRRKFR